MSKTSILEQVVSWVHSDAPAAGAHVEEFWSRAKDAIRGDVYGLETTAADWDLAHCLERESLWFYAALQAAHVWARDAEGVASAGELYRAEVGRVGTAPAIRETVGQLGRPYGP